MLRLALNRVAPSLMAFTVLAFVCTTPASAQDAESLFQDGVDAYRRGDDEAAIDSLKAALATNPGNDEAFRLFQRIEDQVLFEMLVEQGELGSLAGRILEMAKVGRRVVQTDPGGAEDVVARMPDGDAAARREALLELQSTYGAWAVPALVAPLGDRATPDNRVSAIQAILRLGDVCVAPLIPVLTADDELTRTNAASALGSLRDVRAAPALAWMAQGDASETSRAVAAGALAKLTPDLAAMGLDASNPSALTIGLAERYLEGAPELDRPYDSGSVAWTWSDGALVGTPILTGLYGLSLAEGTLRVALDAGSGDAVRAHLAAVHGAMKAEILEASRLPGMADNELLQAATAELPTLDLNLALAGKHRSAALDMLLAARQTSGAQTLLASMGRSADEVHAMRRATGHRDPAVATAAALALGRLGDTDTTVVARLGTALSQVPDRIVMSLGDTGLAGGTAGWQLQTASDVAGGMMRAKAFPPKDVIVVQDGLQGVTLDTLVFGFKNDPRTADVPLIIVSDNVGAAEALYGDQVTAVVDTAGWETVAGAAGDASALQMRAMETAQAAAHVLASMPKDRVQSVGEKAAACLGSGADDATKAAVLHLVGSAELTACLPATEQIVLAGGEGELQIAALGACARLWAVQGPAGDRAALAAALEASLTSSDDVLAVAAAEALGQLGGDVPLVAGSGSDVETALKSLGYLGN